MNELDLAKAVRDGAAPSPSRCGNAYLFAIRISGHGIAERPQHGETAYRPAEIWTSKKMQERAAGLAVVFGHPEKGALNSDEFGSRVIGAIVLPYPLDGELWGIARVLDDAGAAAMESGEFSTSPMATFRPGDATRIEGRDGALLIEGNPSLLDHIAIVPNNGNVGGGVWDKQGPGRGIRIDTRKDSIVTKEVEEKKVKGEAPEEKALRERDEKLDKLVDAVSGIADMCASMGKRLDAFEKERADLHTDPNDVDDVRPRKDAEKKREEEAKLEAEKADAQVRCDAAAMTHSLKAPPPMSGEKLRAYRERLLKPYMRFSKEFGAVNIASLPDGAAFDAVETRVYADAIAATNDQMAVPGHLREVRLRGPGGREIIEFRGDPEVCWAPFKQRLRPGKIINAKQTGAAA